MYISRVGSWGQRENVCSLSWTLTSCPKAVCLLVYELKDVNIYLPSFHKQLFQISKGILLIFALVSRDCWLGSKNLFVLCFCFIYLLLVWGRGSIWIGQASLSSVTWSAISKYPVLFFESEKNLSSIDWGHIPVNVCVCVWGCVRWWVLKV